MSYVESNLLPEERVVFQTKLHWVVYVMPGLVVVCGAVITATSGIYQVIIGEGLGGLILVVGLLVWFARWLKVKTSEFAVTNKRVVIKIGILRRHTLEMLYRQVEAIAVDQGIIARLLGYGTIQIVGTGGTHEPFRGIAQPLEFRRQVQLVSSH